jgi:hypothetical protein
LFKKRDYKKVHRAVLAACDALLFQARPGFDKNSPDDRFVLKQQLNGLTWIHSEATPLVGGNKYLRCAWWSEGASAAYHNRRDWTWVKEVNLEHVLTRQAAISLLMEASNMGEVEDIFMSLETCVILRSEHKRIRSPKNWKPNPSKPGGWWQRYEGVIERVPGPNVRQAS